MACVASLGSSASAVMLTRGGFVWLGWVALGASVLWLLTAIAEAGRLRG